MRIASYDLFKGAHDTTPLLQEFVQREEIDVLCLQEANGWDQGRPSHMERFAVETGMLNYTFGNSNTRYKLATFSRIPLLGWSNVYTAGLWHCAIRTSVPYKGEECVVWNVHLNPGTEEARLDEEAQLTARIRLDEKAIKLGDYNSLSRADGYDPGLCAELVQQGIQKFGTEALRYDVTDYLAAKGLIDAAARLGRHEATVPTPANTDANHAADLRLDYAFATPPLMSDIEDVSVPKDDLTDRISDHYPLIVTLRP